MNYIIKLYSGRIGRKNYGLGLLFLVGSLILLFTIFMSLFPSDDSLGIILMVASYIVFIVYLFSLHARRFHDLGDSGWRVLLFLIPFLNLIMLISLLAKKGKGEANQYGKVPSESVKFYDAVFNW